MSGGSRNTSYGLYVPNFGRLSSPRIYADLAYEAEKAGWDGFFLWDHLVEWNERIPVSDSFTTLAAVAMRTERIRIGTTVTPLPRLKPWIVARQTTSLDHLSNGRMTLGVGLGGEESCDYSRFGEAADNKILARELDESLQVITGLWSGRRFSFHGTHYKIDETVFMPTPVQKPRIPIWVAGFWPRRGPYERAAKWDGVVPLVLPERLPKPDDIRDILKFIGRRRANLEGFEIANIGWTSGVDRKRNLEKVSSYADAGITWWLESLFTKRDSPEKMLKRIRLGPPGM
ncbi:MAG: LLM class flavin-dependent oxidoreductase [Nitrososphaerales archaeon]|jgi:alkanesulfonate monooxygenase SsuD/methylene tetrahydromethanopterin reductase-like flavin-dependent oxidoreductase (luciferase family)